MKTLDLIKLLINSIADNNVRLVLENTVILATTKKSRWLQLWNWVKGKLLILFGSAVLLFPEARRMKELYEAGKILSQYTPDEAIAAINAILDSILINFQDIENGVEIKKYIHEIFDKWPDIVEEIDTKNPKYKMKALIFGIDYSTPQKGIDSLRILTGMIGGQSSEVIELKGKLNTIIDLIESYK